MKLDRFLPDPVLPSHVAGLPGGFNVRR